MRLLELMVLLVIHLEIMDHINFDLNLTDMCSGTNIMLSFIHLLIVMTNE